MLFSLEILLLWNHIVLVYRISTVNEALNEYRTFRTEVQSPVSR